MWDEGFAEGLPQKANIFDEEVERMWVDIWLFYANSTRFASAMAGGGDYGVFANGRYQTTEQLYRLLEQYRSVQEIEIKPLRNGNMAMDSNTGGYFDGQENQKSVKRKQRSFRRTG
jgi:hypothetical protein